MPKLIISGGKPLKGEIELMGSKNVAPKLMVASLLTEEECVIENFPMIGDTDITAELCRAIGSKLQIALRPRRGRVNGELCIQTDQILNHKVQSLSRRNRIPILAMGPLLVRTGKAEVPFLGGDKIGARPVNLHFQALESLGAKIEIGDGVYRAEAPNGLHGATVKFDFPSVGATENALFGAVLARGKTIIINAAIEPEIIDVIKFLQNMGAIIGLGAEKRIEIEGVPRLRGARHIVMSDRNEAASFAALALSTKGDILIRGAQQEHLITLLNAVRRVGGEYAVVHKGIRVWSKNSLRGITIETDTHPGFMTDWQQPFTVALTQAEGNSLIHETIYEDRFGYTNDLNLMGARIKVLAKCPTGSKCRFRDRGFMHYATVEGRSPLRGAKLTTRDLRSGIVNIIAGLTASGETEVSGVEEIDRGYYRIDERLRRLGAEIKRI